MDGPDGTGADALEAYLEHFGIKGMKWGVRKVDGGSSSNGQSEDSKNAALAGAKIKAGGIKSVSNKELQDLVKRMQLEQQFNELKGKSHNTPVGPKAAKFAKDFAINFGKQEVGKILSAVIAKQLKGKIPGLK